MYMQIQCKVNLGTMILLYRTNKLSLNNVFRNWLLFIELDFYRVPTHTVFFLSTYIWR